MCFSFFENRSCKLAFSKKTFSKPYFKKCNLCIIVVNSEEIGFNFWYDYFRVHNKNCPILLCYNLPYDLYIEKKLYDDKNIPNGKQVIKIFNINEIENIKDYLKNINYIGLNFNF